MAQVSIKDASVQFLAKQDPALLSALNVEGRVIVTPRRAGRADDILA